MTRGLIFDMDGVLFDSHPIHKKAWRELLQMAGKLVSDEELEFILDGPKREEILQHFLGTLPQEQVASYAEKKELLFRREEGNLRTIGGLELFLDATDNAGIPKVVATSASKSRAERMLNKFGLSDRFHDLITGDDVCYGKSDPAIFLRGAEKLHVAPRDIVVFEDAAPAIRVATSVGMKCVGIAQGKRRSELASAGATLVISDFTEISIRSIRKMLD